MYNLSFKNIVPIIHHIVSVYKILKQSERLYIDILKIDHKITSLNNENIKNQDNKENII